MIPELFDIAHANAIHLIENGEGKLFPKNQRKSAHLGSMLGLDKIILQPDVKQATNKQLLERKRRLSRLEKFLENSPQELVLNRSTIQRQRKN